MGTALVLALLAAACLQEPAPTEPPPPPPPAPDRWLLMQTLQGTWPGWCLDGHRLSISGWTELSFTGSSAQVENLPMGFNYRANEAHVQQNWLRVERLVNTNGTSPDWGFRSDTILPGIDYRFTLARGVFNEQLTARKVIPNADDQDVKFIPSVNGIDPIQFYVEGYLPNVAAGLDVKVGRFEAIYGVESTEAPANALASHTYTFIYNPFTHTGILATLKLNPAWTVQAAFTLGSDVFIDPAAEFTFTGNVKWAPPNGRDSVLFAVILGSGRYNRKEDFNNPNVFDLVYTHQFDQRLSYSLEALVGYETDVPDVGTAHWAGLVQYLTCQLTPRLSTTARVELFDDEQGNRTGFKGLYTAVTTGLSWKPTPAVIFRPELRYDNNNKALPFEDRHQLFTATADLILRW